ncbi:MAG: RES family NAD+ phosphorylase [Burkholderiaceae bacterium]
MTGSGIVSVWRIATDTPDYTADDMSGEGAKRTGGRWNRKGKAMVYSAQSIALACLETVVHLDFGGLPLNRYLVRIDIPIATWKRRSVFDPSKQVGWDAMPAGKVSLDAGDTWVMHSKTALLQVPSAIVSEEMNILINPAHPDAGKLKAVKLRKWTYDGRFAR